ncbi:Gfo/Idh/MocA family oxidoreductase [bacterium]|nr:Gfo/Idh/MocA family oxidoreductase [bacterium]
MIRFGILSTATIAREQLIPAIHQAHNAQLAAIASRKEKKARSLAQTCGAASAFGSYEEMLASDTIDAVYIPLPTSQHVEWTLKAIKAGKHVLCEKPISLKASDINKLIKARDESGLVVSEAFMVTYHPQWLKVRELVAKGTIGKLRMIDAAFSYFNRDAKNMRNRPELGGGALPDIGVYPTVAARFVTGQEPVSLTANVEFDPDFGTDCYAHTQIAFEDFNMRMYVSTLMALRQSIVFHGEKGFIEVSAPFNSNLYEGDEVRVHNQDHDETKVFRYTGHNQYCSQVEAFSKAVSANMSGKSHTKSSAKKFAKNPQVYSLENSQLNQKVIDAIYKAGKSGKRVTI